MKKTTQIKTQTLNNATILSNAMTKYKYTTVNVVYYECPLCKHHGAIDRHGRDNFHHNCYKCGMNLFFENKLINN